MPIVMHISAAIVVLVADVAFAAGAETMVDEVSAVRPDANRLVGDGVFLPLTVPATVASPGFVYGTGGYDLARERPVAQTVGEARLWHSLAIRVGTEYTETQSRVRPTVGLRLQIAQQTKVGFDAAIGVFYKPEGLTEPEGEIETLVALSRHWTSFTLIGNLVFGQDPGGNERDGEVRFAGHYTNRRAALGLDSRLRFAIGSGLTRVDEPAWDLFCGPQVATVLGPVILAAEGGLSAFRANGDPRLGSQFLGTVGTLF